MHGGELLPLLLPIVEQRLQVGGRLKMGAAWQMQGWRVMHGDELLAQPLPPFFPCPCSRRQTGVHAPALGVVAQGCHQGLQPYLQGTVTAHPEPLSMP